MDKLTDNLLDKLLNRGKAGSFCHRKDVDGTLRGKSRKWWNPMSWKEESIESTSLPPVPLRDAAILSHLRTRLGANQTRRWWNPLTWWKRKASSAESFPLHESPSWDPLPETQASPDRLQPTPMTSRLYRLQPT